jgi:hypothetical protein
MAIAAQLSAITELERPGAGRGIFVGHNLSCS